NVLHPPHAIVSRLEHAMTTLSQLNAQLPTLLAVHRKIRARHAELCAQMQRRVLDNLGEQSASTQECVRHLHAALQVIRSSAYATTDSTSARTEADAAAFYAALLARVRTVASHVYAVQQGRLHRAPATDRTAIVPFLLELMQHARGVVEASPIANL